MDYLGNGIGTQQRGVEAGYNNYNSSGVKEDVFVQKENSGDGARQLQQMPVGKAFQGEVTEVAGEKVSIKLENGQIVQARLGEEMNFRVGDKILFRIKSNAGSTVEIKPVMVALQGQEAAVLKSLEAAKLPVNDKTVSLILNLLKEQMPIDKASVQNLYKQVLANSQTDIQTLVLMNKLQLPVTKESIGQFEAYKNYEHRIASQMEELSGQLMELMQESVLENPSEGKELHMELLELFVNEQGMVTELPETTELPKISGMSGMSELSEMPSVERRTDEGYVMEIPGNADAANLTDPFTVVGETVAFSKEQIGSVLNGAERELLYQLLQELPLSDEIKGQLLDGKGKIAELLNQLYEQLEQYTQFDTEGLIQSKIYTKMLKSYIRQQWFVKPEQLENGEYMKEFYERLDARTGQLAELLNTERRMGSQAAKTTAGIRDNVDFMNQINQMFTYVQVPLMMSGKTAHSDLYVFTKKKNLMEREGKVSALLHLDMESLGSLDIYVEMDGEDVRTQMKLSDEELVPLFEKHMDLLAERITGKGYRFSSSVEPADKKVDFVEDFLERDHGNAPMQRFAFDVRARWMRMGCSYG